MLTVGALLEQAREVLDIEMEGLRTVQARLDQGFASAVNMMHACTGRIVVTGIGKSGLVGRKITATLSSTGTPSFFLHPVEGAHGDLGAICANDLILAISNSGETDELNAILPSLLSLGCRLIALTGNDASTLARMAHVHINCGVPREACPHNLAPTASTTAVLAVGDALAVCLINCRGFTENDFFKVHPGGSLGQRLKLYARDIMHSNIPLADEAATTAEALNILDQGRLGAVILTDSEGKLSGIITDGDVRRAVCRGELHPAEPVSAMMIRNPRHGFEQQSVGELIDLMEQKQITVLPIVNQALEPIGIVHLHDILGKGSLRFSA
ncbi:MAG: KpsF/GutQ family sugar-phosphate isomerase [Desulfovibrionaceae bacterium]|nr:KpsF/GutQ family sugar-phosphate isomerase [Desulfovibrionaceae bacterium]